MDYFEDILNFCKKNIFAIVSILFGIISIVGSIVYVNVMVEPCEPCEICECDSKILEPQTEEAKAKNLVVDVKGAVKKPGVYELSEGSKIQDAIIKAGGLTLAGSTANINLSRKLNDEMVIYVFTKEELKKKETANEVVCEIPKCECETVTVYECPDVNGKPSASEKPGETDSDKKSDEEKDKMISINKATVEEFMTLDGVGEAKAKTIVEYREKNGPFKSIEDIQKVKGIGATMYEKIKDRLTL